MFTSNLDLYPQKRWVDFKKGEQAQIVRPLRIFHGLLICCIQVNYSTYVSDKITASLSSVLWPSKKENLPDSFQKDYGLVCPCESMSVSSGRGQDMGTWNTPTAFVFIPLIIRGSLCIGLLATDNLIVIDAGTSHIFTKICRGNKAAN